MQKLPIAKWLKDYEHCESNYETIYLIHNYMKFEGLLVNYVEFEGLLVKIKWDNISKGDSHNV